MDSASIPEKVWVFWFGRAMSAARAKAFELLVKRVDVPVMLVTEANVSRIVVDGAPLHPAFHFLSAIHKSDYLTAYVSHYHGGGIHDVKAAFGSWLPFFSAARAAQSTYIMGAGEKTWRFIACAEAVALQDDECVRLRRARGDSNDTLRAVRNEEVRALIDSLLNQCPRLQICFLSTAALKVWGSHRVLPVAACFPGRSTML